MQEEFQLYGAAASWIPDTMEIKHFFRTSPQEAAPDYSDACYSIQQAVNLGEMDAANTTMESLIDQLSLVNQ